MLIVFTFLIGILLLPLVYWEVPKVWFYLGFIDLMAILSTFYFKGTNKEKTKNNYLKSFLIIFLVTAVITSIVGYDFYKSVIGNYYRADGLVTLLHLVGFSIIFGILYKDQSEDKKLKSELYLSQAIFFSGVLSSIFNNFGQINFLVGFLLTTIPFGLFLIFNTKNIYFKAIYAIGLLIKVSVILNASSYVGVLGLILIIPLFYVIKENKKVGLFLFGAVVAISMFSFIYFKSITSSNNYVAESRIRIYRNVYVGSLNRFLTGYGWSNTDLAFSSVTWPMKFNNDVYVDKAHMQILDIFANMGIFGVLIYLIINLYVIKILHSERKLFTNTLLVSLLMYFLYAQTNITSISQEFIYWLIIGVATIL